MNYCHCESIIDGMLSHRGRDSLPVRAEIVCVDEDPCSFHHGFYFSQSLIRLTLGAQPRAGIARTERARRAFRLVGCSALLGGAVSERNDLKSVHICRIRSRVSLTLFV